MKKSIIGVSGDVTWAKFFLTFSNKRSGINEAYISTVSNCNGIPVILPVSKPENANQLIDSVDGLILSGGNDVSPYIYGEDSSQFLRSTDPFRDEFEISLLKEAIKQGKPVLGICRGMQLINVAFGGTLYQDTSLNANYTIQHFQQSDPHFPIHSINVMENSILHSILGSKAMVNSIHHQMLKKVSNEFYITATSNDGVIEAIEKKDGSFVLGVQWHPEILSESYEKMKGIFERFIEECNKKAGS